MSEFNTIYENILNYDYISFLSNIFSLLTFESFLKLAIVYFFIVWIAIIIWVIKDIINRTNNIFLQIFSIFTVLLWTPLWIVVYLLIRPSRTLFEQYYEEASIEDSDLESFSVVDEIKEEKMTCPHCNYYIDSEYKFCPNCRAALKKECISCHKEIRPEWSICPYCWKDQEQKINSILEKKSQEVDEKQDQETKTKITTQKVEITQEESNK